MAKRRNESSQMSREEWEQREAADDESDSPSSGGDAGFQRASDAEIRGRTIKEAPRPAADETMASADASSVATSPLESNKSLLELLEPAQMYFQSGFTLTKFRGGSDGTPGVATLETSYHMRQLIELLSAAVLLDSTLLPSMVQSSWCQDYSSSKLTTVGKLELELTVEDDASMEQELTAMFLTPSSTDSHIPECEGVREELLRRVAEAGKMEALMQLRVPVSCTITFSAREKKPDDIRHPRIDLDDDFGSDIPVVNHRETDDYFYGSIRTPDQVSNFFQHVVDLGQRLIHSDRCSATVSWAQFTFTKMQLRLYAYILITGDVVRAARRLSQHRFVSVLDATVDPRIIHCSTSELCTYLQALSRHSPKLHVRTGYYPYLYANAMTAVDADGEDKKELIVKMMTALASCTRLRSVDVGELLSLLAQPHNRLHYWQALLEILLAPVPSTQQGEFSLTMGAALQAEDALLIQQIRGLATRHRRRINCLKLCTTSIKLEAPTIAGVALVRDMEKLEVGDETEPVPAWLTPGVLRVSPKLRSIRILMAEMPSLTVFSDPTISASGRCLEEIVLMWQREITQSSVTAFFTELLDPSTPLAKSLRVLTISPCLFHPYIQEAAINFANAELLERVLCVNHRLERIRVPIGDSGSSILRQALLAHNGEPVWGSAIDAEQRYAFLSVVEAFEALKRLDPTVIRTVFDFAAPLAKRVVSV